MTTNSKSFWYKVHHGGGDPRVRKIQPDEIVLEHDNVPRKTGLHLANKAEENLSGYQYKRYDHGGKSPHIHLTIKGLGELDPRLRRAYKEQFLLNYAGDPDKIDLSLATDNKHIAAEDQPHYKTEIEGKSYGTKELVRHENPDTQNEIELELLEKAKERLRSITPYPGEHQGLSILHVAAQCKIAVNNNNQALCPFHKDTTPSLTLYPDTNSFHCFGCGKSGNSADLLKHFKKIETDAVASQKVENVRSLRNILDLGVPEIEWRVEGILPKHGVAIFGGTAGSMKSWAGMQLSLACATGTDFITQYSTQKCNVLYIDEENGNVTTPFRFDKLVKGHKLEDQPLDNLFVSIFNNITLDSDEGIELLDKLIDTYKPELVILDSMVRCMEGNEDKAEDVKLLFKTIKKYLESGIAFVILHHTTKRDTYNMVGLRGSGDFSAFADAVLMFRSGREGYCNVNVVKNRHVAVEELREFYFALEPTDVDFLSLVWKGMRDEQGNVIDRCVEAIEAWISAENITKFETQQVSKLTRDDFTKSTMYNALNKMVEADKLTKLKRGRYLANTGSQLTLEHENMS